MTLDEIHAEWEKDSRIDPIILGEESLKIPRLHGKYLKILSDEKLLLTKVEAEHARLKFERYCLYTEGVKEDAPEELQKKWIEIAPRGRILKTEAPRYMEGDEDLITATKKVAYQQEKVDVLKSILECINKRSYHIREAIQFAMWEGGK